MAKRTRYQYGSVEIDKRVTGPDVWLYRWWETTSDGRRKRRGFTVGTVEEYKTQAHALKAAEGKRLMINDGVASRAPVLFGAVLDRFLLEQKQEQEAEQITHSTYLSYRSMISQHIQPKWGDVSLQDVRPALVQDWLRKLTLSPKYKGHISSLMYRLFDRAMIWELIGIDRNPMELVEVKGISKRRQRPRILQVKDAWRILDALAQPYRTIVLIALCFGLRISEILGLRWTDFDFKRSAVLIQRSAVGKRLNRVEDRMFAGRRSRSNGASFVELKKWQELCLESEGQWLFPSPVTGRPLHADSIRADYLGSDESAIGAWKDRVPYVPPHLSCVAGRNRSTRGRAAETHATRAHFHHDGPVWQCFDGSQAQSQSASGAKTLEKKRLAASQFSFNK